MHLDPVNGGERCAGLLDDRTLRVKAAEPVLRFEEFALDPATRQLLRGSEPVHLTPKAFDLLCLLLDHRPKAVPKAVIRDRLWPATFVAESNLTSLMSELRTALDDHARHPRFLRTVHGFGYAFCGQAEGAGTRRPRGQVWYFVVQAGREVRLPDGDNILGREPDAAVRLDSRSVSRAHAVIRIAEPGARIADLGSRNGTRVNDRPVRGEVALHDGDRIRLGDDEVLFKTVARTDLGETRPGPSGPEA